MQNRVDLTGRVFGALTVICRDTGIANSRNAFWLCRCTCGGGTSVRADKLTGGQAQICGGCPKPARPQPIRTRPPTQIHGHCANGTMTPEYRSWKGMRQRCHNSRHPDFPDYGGRGISVCDRWRSSFVAFLDDMGARPSPQHSLDRIDGSGNYEPSNCRWATKLEQTLNTTRVRAVTIRGVEFPSITAASIELQIPYGRLYKALRTGTHGSI